MSLVIQSLEQKIKIKVQLNRKKLTLRYTKYSQLQIFITRLIQIYKHIWKHESQNKIIIQPFDMTVNEIASKEITENLV